MIVDYSLTKLMFSLIKETNMAYQILQWGSWILNSRYVFIMCVYENLGTIVAEAHASSNFSRSLHVYFGFLVQFNLYFMYIVDFSPNDFLRTTFSIHCITQRVSASHCHESHDIFTSSFYSSWRTNWSNIFVAVH